MGKRAMAAFCAGLLFLLSSDAASQARQSRIQRAIDQAMARLQGSVVVVDVETGIIRPWIGSRNEIDIDMRRHFGWDGENPSLYLTGGNVVARYSLSSGVKTILHTFTDPAHAIGWNANFTTVTLASNICLQEGTGPFGGDCILWSASMDRLDLVTGATVNILKSKSPYLIDGQLSPGGASIAYLFGNCATGCTDAAGLYVTSSN